MKLRWLLLCALLGCAGPLGGLRVSTPLELGAQKFTLRTHEQAVPADTELIRSAISRATPGLGRWGGLTEPVTVYVVKTHDDLEAAVRRSGFSWLRAWGRYDDVIFQAPSTWTNRSELVDQLVLHELTHCLLFQRSATKENWYLKGIPLWFREGMAITTAGQANLYPSLEDSALWLQRNPSIDGFRDAETLSESQSSEVYGIALHAFEFLEDRYGEDRIKAVMAQMRSGADFEPAFATAVGVPVDNFQKEFENYLKQRSFRGEGRTRPRAAPRP